jgi:hypothetical protein
MASRDGFAWPGVGETATAPDWRDDTECGGGLHGWLYGQGDHTSADYWQRPDSKWLVLEVAESGLRMLGGKCKFPSAIVRFVGNMADAAEFMVAHEPRAATVAVIGRTASGSVVQVGDSGTATAGDRGTATAGALGTATAGDSGTATAGENGCISIQYWDAKKDRYRLKTGYIGEDGLKPNTAYRLDDNHQFVEAAA